MVKNITFVCYGNICRSPMAEYIFKELIKQKGIENQFNVNSRGTSDEEEGNSMYPYARQELTKNHIPFGNHIAKQLTYNEYEKADLVICMEKMNIAHLKYRFYLKDASKLVRLLDYTSTPGDIDDPWYTRNFSQTYQEIYQGCLGLLDYLLKDKTC